MGVRFSLYYVVTANNDIRSGHQRKMSNTQENVQIGSSGPKERGTALTCEEVEAQMRRDAKAKRALTCEEVEAQMEAAAAKERGSQPNGSGMLPGLGHRQPDQDTVSRDPASCTQLSLTEYDKWDTTTRGSQETAAVIMPDRQYEYGLPLRSLSWGALGGEEDGHTMSTGQGSNQD